MMSTQTAINKREMLARHFLFRQLLPTEIDAILEMAKDRHFQDGQTIFSSGDSGNSMMIVQSGRVLISALSEEGKEITLNYIEPGGILGEIALLDGKPRCATATAVGACSLMSIQRNEFIPFLKANSDVTIQLLMVLCEKLRNTSTLAESLGLLPVPARLAKLILKLTEADPKKLAPGSVLHLSISQQKIANLVGTSRETVNRTFSQWQSEGLIRLEQKQLTLLKPKVLIALAESVA